MAFRHSKSTSLLTTWKKHAPMLAEKEQAVCNLSLIWVFLNNPNEQTVNYVHLEYNLFSFVLTPRKELYPRQNKLFLSPNEIIQFHIVSVPNIIPFIWFQSHEGKRLQLVTSDLVRRRALIQKQLGCRPLSESDMGDLPRGLVSSWFHIMPMFVFTMCFRGKISLIWESGSGYLFPIITAEHETKK